MRDFDDDDRAIDARFDALHGSVAAGVSMPSADEIVARGRRRRRNVHAAVSGLAVLAVVIGGYAVLGPLRPNGTPQPPVGPTPAESYTPPAGATRAPLGGMIPPGFLPLEGETSVAARPSGPCPGGSAFTTNGEIAASVSGADLSLFVYSTSTKASIAYGEYKTNAARCATGKPKAPAMGALTFGAQAMQVIFGDPPNVTRVEVAVRYGRALLLVRGKEMNTTTRAGDLERRLCVFATDCAARDGRPAALPALTVGEKAWAAVLAIDTVADAPSLGGKVAAASEMGYRTSVASVDCDQGARQALGLAAGSPHRYVAVYFADRADADTFVAKSSLAPLVVIPVKTYCLG